MSVPAIRSIDRELDKEPNVEETSSAFPPLPQEPESDQRIPTWIQELAKSRAGRSSRASSVVSTRTRFSTTTFDDTRSIEIQAGGQSYRIGRFGDRVTETTAPPPYSGPNFPEFPFHHHDPHDHVENGDDHGEHADYHRRYMSGSRGGGRRGGFGGERRGGSGGLGGGERRGGRRVRIAMPHHEDTVTNNDDDSMTADTPSRVLTDDELRQIIQDLPARLKTVLGIHPEHNDSEYSPTTDAHGPMPGENSERPRHSESSFVDSNYPSVRRDDRALSNGYIRSILRNAPENAPYQSDMSMQERGEVRWRQPGWHDPPPQHPSLQSPVTNTDDEEDDQAHSDPSNTVPSEVPPHHEIPIAPTIADINELSQVYNKVIRDLDREHRKQLHNRDKELDQLRTLLHEKDIVYRQQLKGRDFVIEDMKARLDRIEETIELRLERERYAVEDLWETRWKEHQTQLMEKCGLIRPALGKYAEHQTQTDGGDAGT